MIGLVAAGIALAAAPLPKAGGQYYGTAHNPKSFLVLVISKTDNKKIVSGPDIHTSGPQGSNVDPACPKGQAQAGFNGTTLTLASGHYGFSDKWTSHAQIIESTTHGEKFLPVTLHLTLTGAVKNSKTITGTLSWKGCTGATTAHTTYSVPLGKPL